MRLFEDGYDHYGSDESNMLDGLYAQVNNVELSTAQFVTGTHSLKMTNYGSLITYEGCRWVLPSSETKMGIAFHIYQPGFQTSNDHVAIAEFLSSSPNYAQLTAFLDANGAIRFHRGSLRALSGTTGTLVAQTDPILTANAWHHVEIQVNINDTTGWVRVAVNGVHRYEATGLDTAADSTGIASIGFSAHPYGAVGANSNYPYMDNMYAYDFSGDSSVDTDFCPATDGAGVATSYIGELQVMYLPMNGDTTQMDWVASTGTDEYAMVDETTPNDADYISSTAADELSEFSVTDLPEEITYIRGLSLLGRFSKSDAGAAFIQMGMKSVDTHLDADERPVTQEVTYWRDMANIDPNTTAATGVLTFSGQPANTETVVINGKTYTFQTVLTNTDGNVLIGANLAASITNLADAINLGSGSGTTYAAATTLNADVAGLASATLLTVTAKLGGTDGNAVTTTDTVANASWGGATLSGGDSGARWTRASLNAAWTRLTRSV
jgi:hypothetical protein